MKPDLGRYFRVSIQHGWQFATFCATARRVEFRVICRDRNGTDLTWKVTDNLENAIRYIDNLEPRFLKHGDWLVYEVKITESAR